MRRGGRPDDPHPTPGVDWQVACEAARADANRWQAERDDLVEVIRTLIALIEAECDDSVALMRGVAVAKARVGL